MASNGQISKVSKSDLEEISKCGTCVIGKGVRLPFSSSSTTSSEPLELLHSDLTGPMDASVGGVRYVMAVVDDYTRMSWICLLKAKSEAFEAFKRLRAYLELSTGRRVKTLRTDGGGEYLSQPMAEYLADAGILHQTTCPNSSQQNGVAERFFRTLLDRVRCMLAEAGMAWGWWAEAARMAVYIYNRVPHSHLPDSSSPLSVWLDKPISVQDIRIFGSTCYAIDTSKHRKKSSPRAVECRFLGCETSTKGYRLQVVGSTKVIKSRDVIFHEDHALGRTLAEKSDGTEAVVASDSVGETETPSSVGEKQRVIEERPERPKRQTTKTWKLREAEASVASVPKSYREAVRSDESEGWRAAIVDEFKSWRTKEVYEVVRRPDGEEILPTMLLFNRKTDPQGEEIRKKARCVVIGSRQSLPVFGPGGEASNSPVANSVSFRLMAATAALTNCEFQQMDVNTAYLHAPLSRPTYIGVPAGFPDSELVSGVPRSDQALKLNKAVYGLREAPHSWYAHCSGMFMAVTAPDSSDLCHVLVYVDDFTLMTRTPAQMLWLKSKLAGMFDIKDLGAADQVLGLEVTRDRAANTLKLTQRKFMRKLLEEYDMLDCRPMDTPMLSNALKALPRHEDPLDDKGVEYMRDKDYRRLLGCLNWLAQGTRPDISFAVARLGQAQSNPHPAHWQSLTHVLRYLSKTLDMGLVYSASAEDPQPHIYTDSSFADCPDTRKSHSGYVTLVAGAAVSWSSRKQAIVTTSSTEAEYLAMGHATKEAVWITRLLVDLGTALSMSMRIFADNQSSLLLADSEKLSSRTKHLDVQYHYVREQIKLGKCRFFWIPTKLNTADVLTKPLGPTAFLNMPSRLGLPWIPRVYVRADDEPSNESHDASSGSVG
jgi:hypothetical protein